MKAGRSRTIRRFVDRAPFIPGPDANSRVERRAASRPLSSVALLRISRFLEMTRTTARRRSICRPSFAATMTTACGALFTKRLHKIRQSVAS
jgi:hypothetical protein